MQHEVRPVRYCRTGGSEARKTTAKRPRRSLEAKRSAKGLLAVVPLDPAGNVEGPGVGEEEGPGQEKAVEVLRQRPHLPSPPHTRVSVADPPYVSFHHVRLFQWSEPPQPQMRDPRQIDPSPHSAQRGHGRPKALQQGCKCRSQSQPHGPVLPRGHWQLGGRSQTATPISAPVSMLRLLHFEWRRARSAFQCPAVFRRHQPASKPPPSDATVWVLSGERQLTANGHPACILAG